MSTSPVDSSAPPSLSNRPRLAPPYTPDSVTGIASQPSPQAANSDGDGDSPTVTNSMDTATAEAVAPCHHPVSTGSQLPSSPSPQENNFSTSNYAYDVKPSSSVTDPAREGGVVAVKYPHPSRNETFPSMCNVAEASRSRFRTTRVGCDENKEDCLEVAAHGGGRMALGANGEISQAGCTSSAIMGTGCKEDVRTLMEDVGLLNNLFYSSAASASSRSRSMEENVRSQDDDAQCNISPHRCQDSNSIMEMEDRSNKLDKGDEGMAKSYAGYQSPLPPISIAEAADSVLATAMMLMTDDSVTSLTNLGDFKHVNDFTGTTRHAMKSDPLASMAKSLAGYQPPIPPISTSTDDAAGSVATSPTTLEDSKNVNDVTGTTGHAMKSASLCEKIALTEPVPARSGSHLVLSAGSIYQEAAGSTAIVSPSSPLDLLSSVSATSPCLNITSSSFIGPARELATKVIGRKATSPNLTVLTAEKRWSENLASLRPCIKPGGYTNYVTIDDKGTRTRVHNFFKDQRKSYRKSENWESTNMTDERLKLLEEAKFPFVFRTYPNSSKLITSLAGDQAVIDPEDSAMRPMSTSDLLCSITAQSFKETSSCDDSIDNKDSQETRPTAPTAPPAHLSPATSGFGSDRFVDQRTRSPNCRQFVACVRDNCGECKACRDKHKFGGTNKSRQRHFNRHCISRKKEKRSPQKKKTAVSSKRSEVAMMKLELANIKAELDAKSRGWEVTRRLLKEVEQSDDDEAMLESGFADGQEVAYLGRAPGYTERKFSRPVENSLKEAKKSDDEDEVMDTAESYAHKSTHDLCNAVFTTAMATLMAADNTLDISRGVMVRPSGKWQVQLYYAGSSRYIGLFDTRKEANMAYDMARKCCDSFKRESPTLEQVERNLNLMREAAFSVVERKPYYSEESKQNDQPKERSVLIQKDKVEKSTAVAVKYARVDDDVAMKTGLAKANDGLDATAQGETKPLGVVMKLKKAERKVEVTSTDEVTEDSDTRKRKLSHKIYQKANASADALPRGITVRPSGKWQVQLFYAGKSRYIGVFDSKLDAAAAYELARDCFISFKDIDPSPQQTKKNVELMRKAAFSFTRNNSKKQKTSVNDSLVAECCDRLNKPDLTAETALLTQKPCAKKPDPKKSTGEPISETSFKTRVELGVKSSHEKKEGPTKIREKKKIKKLSPIKQAAPLTAGAMVVAERKRAKRTPTAVARIPTSAEKKKAKQALQIKQAAPIVAPVAVGESKRIEQTSTVKKAPLAKLENIKRKQEEYLEVIQHNDLCECCGDAGDLLCCSTCNLVFHLGCTRPKLAKLPEDDWRCAFCVASGCVVKKASRQEQRKARVAVREIEALKAEAIKKKKSRRKSSRKRKKR